MWGSESTYDSKYQTRMYWIFSESATIYLRIYFSCSGFLRWELSDWQCPDITYLSYCQRPVKTRALEFHRYIFERALFWLQMDTCKSMFCWCQFLRFVFKILFIFQLWKWKEGTKWIAGVCNIYSIMIDTHLLRYQNINLGTYNFQ